MRLALGATGGRLVRLFVAEGLVLLLIGLVVGVGLALAVAAKPMEVLLFETSIREPAVLLLGPAVLGLTGLAASFIPAARAARVNPLASLPAE